MNRAVYKISRCQTSNLSEMVCYTLFENLGICNFDTLEFRDVGTLELKTLTFQNFEMNFETLKFRNFGTS